MSNFGSYSIIQLFATYKNYRIVKISFRYNINKNMYHSLISSGLLIISFVWSTNTTIRMAHTILFTFILLFTG